MIPDQESWSYQSNPNRDISNALRVEQATINARGKKGGSPWNSLSAVLGKAGSWVLLFVKLLHDKPDV
jgi:hypothetical protein